MKKTFLALAILLVFVTVILGGCGQKTETAESKKTEPEVIDLNFVSAYVDAHPTSVNAFKPWIEKVEELSNGRLKIHFYAPNTLCPEKDTFDSTVGGFVDIGSSYNGYNPGKFPVSEVMDLPLLVQGAESGALVTWDLYNNYPEIKQEYSEGKLLWMWTSATYNLHTVNKEIQTLEDLKGLKIIGWSPKILEMIKLLGANPIEISALDTYMSLERGMADGVLCPLAPVRSFKITDVSKYHTIVDLSVGPFYSVMNKTKWDSLPADLQKILEDTTGAEMARNCGVTLDEGAVADSKWMMDNGHSFYVLPETERERWVEAITPMYDEWVANMENKGIENAREILNAAQELGKEYDKTTGKGFVE